MKSSCAFLLFILLCDYLVAGDSTARTTFIIEKEKEQKQSISLQSGSKHVSCKFQYNTNTDSKLIKDSVKTPKEAVDELTESHPCIVQRQSNGWEYKICLGESINQVLDPQLSFNLGKFSHFDEASKSQIYNGGSDCGAQGARETAVHFSCAARPSIIQVEEPSMCRYKMTLGFPDLCNHPDFQIVTAGGSEQTWFLELSKMHDGKYLCTAQFSGTVPNEDLSFSQFSLYFGGDVEVESYKARAVNRHELKDDDIEVVSSGIQSASDFKSTLRFVSISSKIKESFRGIETGKLH